MKFVLGLMVAVLVACAPYQQPSSDAPFCTDPNVYIDQGTKPRCQLKIGQRYVIQMRRSQGDDDSLRRVCLDVWHGAGFVVNYGQLDYCVMPTKTA